MLSLSAHAPAAPPGSGGSRTMQHSGGQLLRLQRRQLLAGRPAPRRGHLATISAAAAPGDDKPCVNEPPGGLAGALGLLGQLLDTNPDKLAKGALGRCPFAKSGGTFYIADPPTVDDWMPREWERGTRTGWPETISQLLGEKALAVTQLESEHQALRRVFEVMRTDEQVERVLPFAQAAAKRYLADWSRRGTVLAYPEVLTLVFDVLVNGVMQLGWSDQDIREYSGIFETWNQGFTIAANPLPFSKFKKGMAAREVLIERFRRSLRDPKLPAGSIPAVLRDTYGADSPVCTDNLIMVIFAGYETSCSLATGLLWHLARQPEKLAKLREEQRGVAAGGGGELTIKSLKQMRYTGFALDEVLRLSQIVASVPRVVVEGKELEVPRAETTLPAGSKISVSWGGMSNFDPAVQGDAEAFRPERWDTAEAEKSKRVFQRPFGYGQHDCVGWRVARGIAYAVAQELVLKYNMSADAQDSFDSFPTGGRPRNELPLTLTPL